MKSLETIILYTFLLICVVQTVYGIKCWDCRSDSDPKCGDPFDNTTLAITDCSKERPLDHLPEASATMCRKVRQKVHGEWRYFRSCAYMGEPGIEGDERFCLMRAGSYNIFMEYCTCNSKDGCNSSGLVRSSYFVMTLSTLAVGVIAWLLHI